jgi:hypothetical protein
MRRSLISLIAVLLLSPAVRPACAQAEPPVAATIETTLRTADGKIRQFAFDGALDTYFATAQPIGADDHFTLVFDRPVTVTALAVLTGQPDGSGKLDSGALEVSEDGTTFTTIAPFLEGEARAQSKGRQVRAVRLKPTGAGTQPFAIREFAIESSPKVAVFQYPIEFTLDVSDAPEMKEWGEKVVRICERQYAMINDELKSDGFKPPHLVTMELKNSYKGVAQASGSRITGAVKYFKAHPDDVGAMVHETAHVVQRYRTGNNPGWLVEGIADYVRFFKYEPGRLGRIDPERARYNGSYRTSAAFLAFVAENHDKEIVRKLNKALREGEYREDNFKVLTKKTVQELDEEWRKALRQSARAQAEGPGLQAQAGAPKTAKIVLVAGSNFFKPGEHEYVADCAVLADLLKQTPGVVPVLALDWPKDPETFAGARAVVFLFDGGDKHALLQDGRLAQVQKLVDAGVGLVHLHQVIDYPKDLGARARGWMGATWEKGYGQRAHWISEFKAFPEHPVCRGVAPFKIDDGWIYKLKFVPGLKGITPLLRTVSPRAPAGKEPGDEAIVSWAYERPGGGRSFTFTGCHLHSSFAEEGYRRFLVNGIRWTAGVDIPSTGAPVALAPGELNKYLEKRPAPKGK